MSQYDRGSSGISIFCYRGIAQSGSAPALGAGCREFESLHPDHKATVSNGLQDPPEKPLKLRSGFVAAVFSRFTFETILS